ncbi:MAG TPA: thiol reductant ABC exporter subunit CydC [Solirubrobacteraceae bacterium]|nr:thiol reductant ABC exporter subunit CydC [Solirubrobacteraceae bacterium]
MSARASGEPSARALARTLGLDRRSARPFVAATLLGAGSLACAIGLIATSAWLISRSSQRPPESALAVATAGVQFFALGRGLLRYGERLAGHDAALRLLAGLRVRVYRHLEILAPAGLPAFRSGDLLGRLVQDVDSLQELVLRVWPPFAIAALVGAGVVVLLATMLPAAAVIVAAALLASCAAVPWLVRRHAARFAGARAAARGELSATTVDVLAGAGELTVYGAIDGALAEAGSADSELTRVSLAAARGAGAAQGVATVLMGLAMWGSLAVGVAAVASGELAGVLLAGLALIPLAAFELVAPLPAAAQNREHVARSAARVDAVLAAPAPVREPDRPRPVPAGPHALAARGLRCTYPGSARRALDGVDLDIAPGRHVAVVGPSGAGKTTLAWALARLIEYEGLLTLDGAELSALEGVELRRVVGIAEQQAHVFATTVAENLLLARREASDDELFAALEDVRLAGWVRALPEGLKTDLGERGSLMSGGQRQRLGLARALLADFPVLILDEPGEHLDGPTADAVVGRILARRRGRTTVLITHRLAGLEELDEILVLDGGRVTERGSQAALLRAGGRYTALRRSAD